MFESLRGIKVFLLAMTLWFGKIIVLSDLVIEVNSIQIAFTTCTILFRCCGASRIILQQHLLPMLPSLRSRSNSYIWPEESTQYRRLSQPEIQRHLQQLQLPFFGMLVQWMLPASAAMAMLLLVVVSTHRVE